MFIQNREKTKRNLEKKIKQNDPPKRSPTLVKVTLPKKRCLNDWQTCYLQKAIGSESDSSASKVGTPGSNSSAAASNGKHSVPNIKELTNKQRNWFSNFERGRSPSVTSGSPAPSDHSELSTTNKKPAADTQEVRPT